MENQVGGYFEQGSCLMEKIEKKILLIEPTNTFAQFAMMILSRLGYKVSHSTSVASAIEMIKIEMPELVISETKLQDNNVLELCKFLKKDSTVSNIPIIIISTDGLSETRQTVLDSGCVDYATKPVSIRTLNALIEKHLPMHNKRRHIRAEMQITAVVNDGSQSVQLKTLNVGEGGLYLVTEQPYAVGTILSITLSLPNLKNPLELKGEVLYINKASTHPRPTGVGIKFVEFDQNTSILFSYYLEGYLSDFQPLSPVGP